MLIFKVLILTLIQNRFLKLPDESLPLASPQISNLALCAVLCETVLQNRYLKHTCAIKIKLKNMLNWELEQEGNILHVPFSCTGTHEGFI